MQGLRGPARTRGERFQLLAVQGRGPVATEGTRGAGLAANERCGEKVEASN